VNFRKVCESNIAKFICELKAHFVRLMDFEHMSQPESDANYHRSLTGEKAVLFLQGPPSGFARELGDELARAGHYVRRVNFCTGDWISWHDKRTLNFRGRKEDWEAYIAQLILREQITDIVYFADRLPYHRIAAKVARKHGIRAISYEFGYLRPDWIVVEQGGQSIYSHFPNDLKLIKRLAKDLPVPEMKLEYPFSLLTESVNEVVFNLSNYFLWFFYPHYDCDKFYNPILEYLSYIRRFAKGFFRQASAEKLIKQLASEELPYFVIPLQMQNDYQLRGNSSYQDFRTGVDQILRSFLDHSQDNSKLIFKKHPLDNGLENWGKYVAARSAALGLSNRVFFVDGGDLDVLLKNARGTITVNSTSGIQALRLGSPVKVLGVSVYDIAGLTHQGSLNGFWKSPKKPAINDVQALVKLLAAGIHVKGNFYSRAGKEEAVNKFAARLIGDRINAVSTFIDPPPRIAKARKLGIYVDHAE